MSLTDAAAAANVTKTTSIKWYSTCRQLCSAVESTLPKMTRNPDKPIQIDESYFSGRRKYNRGRLNKGDKKAAEQKAEEIVYEIEMSGWVVHAHLKKTQMSELCNASATATTGRESWDTG